MNVVAFVNRAVELARQAGLTVTFEPGWETRGNGYAGNYVGVLVHHTGTPSSLANPFPTRRILRDGRPDLTGPLCNSAGPADGSIHVMAANAANHAGAGAGRAMGPLPRTRLFNPKTWGHEIDYAGTVPMLAEQYRAAAVWAHCILVALVEFGQIPAFDPQRARLHAETSETGKWDPGAGPGHTIDAAAFRAAVAAPIQEDTFMADVTAADQEALIWRVHALIHGLPAVAGGPLKGEKVELTGLLAAATQKAVADYLAAHPPTVAVDLDYAAMAKANADEADRRARDNDPATGPRS